MKENRSLVCIPRAALCLIAGAMLLCQCDGGSRDAPGGKARVLQLTSEHTEIVISSSKVPGYWAKQTKDGEVLFLSTRAGDFEKGDTVEAKGPLGFAMASVYDGETGVYQKYWVTNIVVVWEMGKAGPRNDAKPAR